MTSLFALETSSFMSFLKGIKALILENPALRQELAIYKRTGRRPRLRPADRVFWVCLSKLSNNWRAPWLANIRTSWNH